jgi:hypothetical protein
MSHLPRRTSSTLDLGLYGSLGLYYRGLGTSTSIDSVPDGKENRNRQSNYLAPWLLYVQYLVWTTSPTVDLSRTLIYGAIGTSSIMHMIDQYKKS